MSNIKLKVKAGLAGKYKLRTFRVDSDGNELTTYESGWFDNLITDDGLEAMSADGWADSCQVGSDGTAPANSNSTLGSYVAGTSTLQTRILSAQPSAPWYGSTTYVYRFGEGAASGAALAEVGIASATVGGTLFSRALILDGGGSPTTITVLADEFLDVTYQLQLVPPTVDATTTVVDSGPAGTSHAITIRAAKVDQPDEGTGGWSADGISVSVGEIELRGGSLTRVYNGTLGTIDDNPSGTGDNASSVVTDAYVGASLERTGTITLDLNDGNLSGGISAMLFQFGNAGAWQCDFDPAIAKDNTKTLNIDVSVTWDRTTAL